MKTVLFFFLSLAFALFIESCVSYQERLPATKENLYVYTLESPKTMSPGDIKPLIQKYLGVSDIPDLHKSDDNTVYFVSDADVNETLQVNLSNRNLTFNKGKKAAIDVPELPSREKAIKRAEDFLGDNALLPRNREELKLAHFGGLRSSSVSDGKKVGPIIDEMVIVTYGRMIDNLPVIGPGSKIVVKLGDHGEVMGLIYRWREIKSKESVKPEATFSMQQAEEMAKRQILMEYGPETSYKILGSGKAYYDNNGSILQPVYVFETSINMQRRDEHVKPFNYLCVIPMLKISPEPLNLTAIDPKAKTQIKTIKRGEKLDQEGGKRAVND
jgi:hypothetical protein